MKAGFATLGLLLLTTHLPTPSFADGADGDHRGHGGESDNHGRLHTPAPQSDDEDEVDSTDLVASQIAGLGCDQAGEALRRISNHLLSLANNGDDEQKGEENDDSGDEDHHDGNNEENGPHRWQEHLGDTVFLQKLWDRLAGMYRACGRTCFDDGLAVGQISAAGYCAASIATGGLADQGVIPQPALPLCQNAIFIGCQSGYRQTASTYAGCQAYSTGSFQHVFNSFISQDCHQP